METKWAGAPLMIGLAGKAGAGKTTVAMALSRLGMERASFAGGIRRCVAQAFASQPLDRDDSSRIVDSIPGWLIERKDEPLPVASVNTICDKSCEFLWRFMDAVAVPVANVSQPFLLGKSPSLWSAEKRREVEQEWLSAIEAVFPITGRRVLQVLGTDIVRKHVGPYTWIDRWAEENFLGEVALKSYVFDDVRFPNEVSWILANLGLVFYLAGAGHEGEDAHVSECKGLSGDPLVIVVTAARGDFRSLTTGVIGAIAEYLADESVSMHVCDHDTVDD